MLLLELIDKINEAKELREEILLLSNDLARYRCQRYLFRSDEEQEIIVEQTQKRLARLEEQLIELSNIEI
jgi:predicted translin family RNA/ssDNA-binding protein